MSADRNIDGFVEPVRDAFVTRRIGDFDRVDAIDAAISSVRRLT